MKWATKHLSAVAGLTAVLAMTSASMGGTIADARAAAANTPVTVENVVISSLTDLINSTNSKSFQIQDDTGAITVYGSNADVDALLAGHAEGDRVTFSATRGADFNGLAQLLAPFTPSTLVDSPGAPAATPVTVADFQDQSGTAEALESKIVKLSNVRFTTSGNFAYGVNYYLNADGNPATLPRVNFRVSTNQMDLIGQPIPTGLVNVTGIFSQYDFSSPFDGFYQLLVRTHADVEKLSPSAAAGISVTVKNAPRFTITLQATAIDGGALSYKVTQTADKMFPTVDHGAQGGTLYLPGTNTPVTLNAALPANQVDFEPAAGVSGWYQFQFTVSQPPFNDAVPAPVDVFIQDPAKVVISEIMYQPMGFQFDWEYVEVTNVSGADIVLDTLFDALLRNTAGVEHNLLNADDYGSPTVDAALIPAGQTRVIMENTAYRSTAQFLNVWNPGAGDVTFPVQGGELNKIQRQHLMVVNYAASSGSVATAALNNEGDMLVLLDAAGNCLDVVRYENGTNGWPAANDSGSIYLESNKLTVTDNDSGANWRLSATGVAGSNAYASVETFGPPREANVGSPALLPTAPTSPVTLPVADYQIVDTIINQGAANYLSITLTGSDPNSLPLTYKVMSLVEGFAPTTGGGGSLKDGGTLADVTPGATLSGNTVLFKPDGAMSGRYAFTFVANNGMADSVVNYVTLFVQGHNRVVITEVMYNPWNQSNIEWEWIEVANLTASDVQLHSLLDEGYRDYTVVSANSKPGNLVGITIPANGTRVIAREIAAPVSPWLTEWYKPSAATATVFIPDARWPALNNSTASGKSFADRAFLLSADGELLDVVAYDDGAPWPVDINEPVVYAGHSSIYFTPGTLDTFANDAGANWAYSVDGVDQAYATTNGLDFGSPGILASAPILVFDFTGDGAVDTLNDLPVFLACGSGPGIPHDQSSNCQRADYNDDNDVDGDDFGMFQSCLQAGGMTPAAGCLQ